MKHHFPKDLYTNLKPSPSHLLILGGVFFGALIVGCISLPFWPKAFTAKATIVIQPDSSQGIANAEERFSSRRFFKTQANIIRSSGMVTPIAGELGLSKRWGLSNRKTTSILEKSTKVTRRYGDRAIDIEFSSKSPEQSVEIANAIGAAYIDYWRNLHSDRYDEMVKNIEADHNKFKSAVAVKLAALDVLESDEASNDELEKTKAELADLKVRNATFESQIEKILLHKVVVASAARFEEEASLGNVRYGSNFGAGLVLLLMMAIFATSATASVLFWQTRGRVSISDIARAVSPPTLALFPRCEKAFAEMSGPFQKLGEGILGLYPKPEGVTVVSVPCLVEEDASAIACELAKTLSGGGHSTLIIEGNLKEPMIHHTFNASPHPGVSDYLVGEMTMKETVVKTRHDNLWMMPGGTLRRGTSELLESEKMKVLIKDAQSRFDFVIFNGSPILSSVDSLILIGESDMTFLCTEAGKASNDVLVRTRYAIEQAGGRLAGLVLTNVEPDEAKKEVGVEAAVVKA